jgi:fucose permease
VLFTAARVLAGLYTRRVGGIRVVYLSMGLGLLLSTALWLSPSPVLSCACVVLIGFALAPIFPGLVSGTEGRVGRVHAPNTIGMQMAAAGLSVAVTPSVIGVVARRTSLEAIPVALFMLFAVSLILYFWSQSKTEPLP